MPELLAKAVANALGGVALALSFALLFQRRGGAMPLWLSLQTLTVAALATWQAWLRGSAALGVAALLLLAAGAVALPAALRWAARRLPGDGEPPPRRAITLAAGAALVAVAGLATQSAATPEAASPSRETMTFALAVALLGVLLAMSRAGLPAQLVGLLSLDNGVMLLAVALPASPLLPALVLATLALAGGMVAATVLLHAPTEPTDGAAR
jgi:hydrogenase-4 component E